MRGRWYHPLLRRFLSPDPVAHADGQGLNRYSYVRNSPFALTDPSGWNPFVSYEDAQGNSCTRGSSECIEIINVFEQTDDAETSDGTDAGDGGASERAHAGAAGQDSNADAGGGINPLARSGTTGEEAAASLVGLVGGGIASVGSVPAMSMAAMAAPVVPLLVVGAGAFAVGYGTGQFIQDPGGSMDAAGAALWSLGEGFVEPFEKASVEGAPLQYHLDAGWRLGGFMATAATVVMGGPLLEAGLGVVEVGGARTATAVVSEAVAPRALPGPRQIQAAWGASRYNHGGLMTGMEHIMYRHSWSSGFTNVGRYAEGTTARAIVGHVDRALRYGTVIETSPGAFTVNYDVGRVIGTNQLGAAASSLRVFVRNTIIQSAFPY